MWQYEPRLVHYEIVVQHEIEIQCARTPALQPKPAALILYEVQAMQEIARGQSRFQSYHLVQVPRLVRSPQRFCLFLVRNGYDAGIRQVSQGAARKC
jgi:hypothetical protein